MRNSIKAYAYALGDGWYFSKNKLGDCPVSPDKMKITFLPETSAATEQRLRHALRSGLAVQKISKDEV